MQFLPSHPSLGERRKQFSRFWALWLPLYGTHYRKQSFGSCFVPPIEGRGKLDLKKSKVDFIFDNEIEAEKDGKLVLKTGESLDYSLLVGSDGQKSKVKQLRNISSHGWSHNQKAIVKISFILRFVQSKLSILPLLFGKDSLVQVPWPFFPCGVHLALSFGLFQTASLMNWWGWMMSIFSPD